MRGWVLSEPLANASAGGALILDNFWCTLRSISPRGGCQAIATLPSAVTSMFSYKSGAVETFFATTGTDIYDITGATDPLATLTADVSGQTGGIYAAAQFGTAGGDYFYAVNGADDAQLFDGTTWQAVNDTSALAITGVPTASLSHVWSYASRLFFVEKDTMSAWALPVDSIAGAAVEISFAGIFKKGGSLLFGATWSLDAGDGLDDKCLFVSSEGEVAVYEGINPASAPDWRKVGVYDITSPLGAKAIMQAGGDLLIAAESGLVPISQAINNDIAALTTQAVSSEIYPHWQKQVAVLQLDAWEIIKWPEMDALIVSQPGQKDGACLVANLQTGAWSRFTGWDTNCLGYFAGSGYFGATDGTVNKMNVTGSDNGKNYTAVYLGQFSHLDVQGQQKTVHQMRAIFETQRPQSPQITMQNDYSRVLEIAPDSVSEGDIESPWDTAVWDANYWDGIETPIRSDQWLSIGRTGFAFAPEIQMTFGVSTAPISELVSVDITYSVGALVT